MRTGGLAAVDVSAVARAREAARGDEVKSETLNYISAKLQVIEQIRAKDAGRRKLEGNQTVVSADDVQRLLASCQQGYLQTDVYAGFNALFQEGSS